jgi:hypothetical protein
MRSSWRVSSTWALGEVLGYQLGKSVSLDSRHLRTG